MHRKLKNKELFLGTYQAKPVKRKNMGERLQKHTSLFPSLIPEKAQN